MYYTLVVLEKNTKNLELKVKFVDFDTVIVSVPKISGGTRDLTFAYMPTVHRIDVEIKEDDPRYFWAYFHYVPDNYIVQKTESARNTIISESPREFLERSYSHFPQSNDPNIYNGGVHILRWHELNRKEGLSDEERVSRFFNNIPHGLPMVLPSELGITEQMYDRAHHLAFDAFIFNYKKRKKIDNKE